MKYFEVIKSNPLFKGIADNDIEVMLNCLSAANSIFEKGCFVVKACESITSIGILLSGKLAVLKDDVNGYRNIIAEITPGEMYGEAFACAGIEKSSVSVQASVDSEILLFNYRRIITTCSSACDFHSKLIENMLAILAEKILMLNQKMEFVSKRTTREKLLAFFEAQKRITNSNKFTISYNREQLADFLFLDRSSMSRELCKMRDDGLIKFDKNEFKILI
jgi:CRP-like cAMP-binding protein